MIINEHAVCPTCGTCPTCGSRPSYWGFGTLGGTVTTTTEFPRWWGDGQIDRIEFGTGRVTCNCKEGCVECKSKTP